MTRDNDDDSLWEEQWRIFHEALDREPAERDDFVEARCSADPRLRKEVEDLLAAHEREGPTGSGTFLIDDSDYLPPAAGAESLAEPGELLAGRYEIFRRIGSGGSGQVYAAHDQVLGGEVAVKILIDRYEDTSDAADRLRREVRLARRITHRNACRTYDMFQLRDRFGMTMELLRGETLAERLLDKGSMPPDEALPIIRQVSAALEEAHDLGIVHRDLKCSNLMLEPGSRGVRAVVMDFGLAVAPTSAEASLGHLTKPGQLLGTPDFMAPEQLLGEEVTPATDLYSLGLVIYQMITGELPFADGHWTLLRRTREDVPSPRSIVESLDGRWERAILACLKRDPSERPSSPSQLIAMLDAQDGPL